MAIRKVNSRSILDGTVATADLDDNPLTIDSLVVDTDTLVVDATNNRVGIGTSSPSYKVTINTPDENHLRLENGSELGIVRIMDSGAFDIWVHGDNSTDVMTFTNGSGAGTERMRLESGGHLMVGTTDTNPANNGGAGNPGVAISPDGVYRAARTGNVSLDINRMGSDGDIAAFRKDGNTVGSIGSANSGADLYINSTDDLFLRANGLDGIQIFQSGGSLQQISCYTNLYPSTDNAFDVGTTSLRWDDIFATNGTIQTSDANEKQQIAALTDAEMTAAKSISALFKTFKWNSAVEAKGDEARTHTGVIAQDVQSAMTAAGLDAGDYAFFISSTWWETQTEVPAVEADEEGGIEAVAAYTRIDTYNTAEEAPESATERTRMGIRYPQLLAFIGAATEQRLSNIETRLAALES